MHRDAALAATNKSRRAGPAQQLQAFSQSARLLPKASESLKLLRGEKSLVKILHTLLGLQWFKSWLP